MSRKTVVTKEIDGLVVVVGFDELRPDPIGTKNVVSEMLANLPEASELARVANRIDECRQELRIAVRGRDDTEIENLNAEIEALKSQLETLQTVIREKRKEMIEENAVYLEPPLGEFNLPEEEINALRLKFDNLDDGSYLLKDGTVIDDLRGFDYWEKVDDKWTRSKVEKLGENIDGNRVRPEDLKQKDIDEIESQRIGELSDEEKSVERDRLVQAATNEAVLLLGRLELVDDDPEALTKARAFLSTKKAEIDSIYN